MKTLVRMINLRGRELALLALAISVTLIVSACGNAEPTTAEPDGNQSSKKLSGTIDIDGSSTVFPITEAVAEEFRKVHPGIHVNVGVSGTGGGFKRFAVGETAITNASRPIKISEAEKAAANGIEYLEIMVAMDGLSVMVSNNNDFVKCLTVEELKAIWEPGSTVDNWNQVRSSFPSKPLRLYGPDTDSGTFDYFTEEIIGEAQASRPDYTASADDNVLVRGIGGDVNSLGYFGYAYYIENLGKLNVIAIDAGNGCVVPSSATIESGKYTPLSRPLFIYVNTEEAEKPEVNAFIKFYLENAGGLATEVGYIGLSDSQYGASLAELQFPR